MTSLLARIIVYSFLSLLFIPHLTSAETKNFIKEYAYQASEYDSKVSCRVLALEQAKRLLLEEMGTYLESETEVKDFQLTKDQITTLTAGIVQSEIVEEKWDGKIYWLKVKISADPDLIVKSINELRYDKKKTKELERIRKKLDALVKKNEQLQKELKIATSKNIGQKKKEYNKNIRQISAMERWAYYASNLAGCDFYYDTNTIEKISNRSIKVWKNTVCHTFDGKWKSLLEINCKSRIYRSLEMVTKDGHDTESSAWSSFIPESYDEPLYDILCKKK